MHHRLWLPAILLFGTSTPALAQVSPPTAGFAATPTKFLVPDDGTASGYNTTSSGKKNRRWAFIDLTGDRKPDLVRTADPKTDDVFGKSTKFDHWEVYENTGTALVKNGTTGRWTVPDSGTVDGFNAIASGESATRQWVLLPMRDRSWFDLVQVADPKTGKLFADDNGQYWKIWGIETAQRFRKTPDRVVLKPSGKEKGFNALAAASGTDGWTTFDLDGDGLMDIVQTLDPKTGKVWVENGKKIWRLYRGALTGLSGQNLEMGMYGATPWTLPEMGLEAGFTHPAMNQGTKQWSTFDIDGDGKPDLVQTADPKTGKVWGAGTSNPHWRVYKRLPNPTPTTAGFGFATTPTLWPVPDAGVEAGFAQVASGGAKNWLTIDLDGDGKPDLVQTSQNNGKVWGAGTNQHSWKLFKNTGAGFARVATAFPVPQNGFEAGFYAVAASDATKQWTLVDIDGDRRLDLVLTADPMNGNVFGDQVPAPTPTAGNAPAPAYSGPRVDAAKAPPSLKKVLGAVPERTVLQPYWRVYRGQP